MLDRLPTIEIELAALNERRHAAGDPARTELGFREGDPSISLDVDAQKLILERKELTDTIANGKVLPAQKKTDSVYIGDMVKLVGEVNRRRAVRYVYVGGHYDCLIPWTNLPKTVSAVVSYDCGIGKELLRKTVGDEVVIKGRGELAGTWEIDEIKVAQFLQSVAA